jgi:hypothetical protein
MDVPGNHHQPEGTSMQNISIGRYSEAESLTHGYDGWIEGIRADGTTWIMWLDDNGSPRQFYGDRDPEGWRQR